MEQKRKMSRQEQKSYKEFEETFLSIFRPKLVMPSYEDMPIPKKIRESIMIERLILAKNGDKIASETEALWYLSTASLSAPLDHHFSRIMQYLCKKWITKQKKELPDFLKEKIVLEELEERELAQLRH